MDVSIGNVLQSRPLTFHNIASVVCQYRNELSSDVSLHVKHFLKIYSGNPDNISFFLNL